MNINILCIKNLLSSSDLPPGPDDIADMNSIRGLFWIDALLIFDNFVPDQIYDPFLKKFYEIWKGCTDPCLIKSSHKILHKQDWCDCSLSWQLSMFAFDDENLASLGLK